MNDENLIPLNRRTERERKEIQSKGGKATAEARRQRRTIREALETLMANKYVDRSSGREVDGVTALALKLFSKAMDGDIKATELIFDYVGETPAKQIDITGTLATDAKFTELLDDYGV